MSFGYAVQKLETFDNLAIFRGFYSAKFCYRLKIFQFVKKASNKINKLEKKLIQ